MPFQETVLALAAKVLYACQPYKDFYTSGLLQELAIYGFDSQVEVVIAVHLSL